MEYVAKFDFNPSQEDELAFRKGDIVKVVDKKKDKNWYKAELRGRQGLVPKNYIEGKPHDVNGQFPHEQVALVQPPQPEQFSPSCPDSSHTGQYSLDILWYVGHVRRKVTEDFLMKQPEDGTFVVRDSESSPGDFSLSVKYAGQVQHFKVLVDGAGKYFIWVVKFNSLNELVEYHRTNSISRTVKIYLKDVDSFALSSFKSGHDDTASIKVRAKYDFDPQESGELSFRFGDVIRVLEQTDANWWKGECRGRTGMFPTPYVEVINEY